MTYTLKDAFPSIVYGVGSPTDFRGERWLDATLRKSTKRHAVSRLSHSPQGRYEALEIRVRRDGKTLDSVDLIRKRNRLTVEYKPAARFVVLPGDVVQVLVRSRGAQGACLVIGEPLR